MRRPSLALALVVLVGCGEEQGPTVTPIPTTSGARRAPIAEEPSPMVVSPHLRRTENADRPSRDPVRSLGGGGGGSSADWTPRPPPAPSQREVEAFRERLQEEIADVDAEDDPCEQLRDVMRAGAEAHDPSGRPDVPSMARMRERCRNLPQTYLRCLTPDYQRQHTEECTAELERMAARGRRRTEEARRRVDAMRRGDDLSPRDDTDREPPEDG